MIARRQFLKTSAMLGVAAGIAPLPKIAFAAARIPQLRIVALAAAGSGYDETARVCEKVLSANGLIGGSQITNLPGAGGTVGLVKFVEQHAKRPDALLVSGSTMVNSIIANKTPIDLGATTPLARIYGTANVIVVPASSPYRSLQDLVAAFKADPGTVAWAGGSIGGGDHLIAGLFAKAVGVDPKRLNYVAFPGGGEIIAALLGGHVAMASSSWSEFAEQIRSGEMRALDTAADRAISGIEVVTLQSQGVDVAFYTWRALVAAPGITAEERGNLIGMLDEMVKSAAWKDESEKRGWLDLYLPGDAFSTYVEEQTVIFRATLASLGLA